MATSEDVDPATSTGQSIDRNWFMLAARSYEPREAHLRRPGRRCVARSAQQARQGVALVGEFAALDDAPVLLLVHDAEARRKLLHCAVSLHCWDRASSEARAILAAMRTRPEDLVAGITSREDMASFLDALSTDAIEHGSEWENLHIFDMLESMGAWLRDSVNHEAFSHPDVSPEQWRFFAELMLSGKHYE